MYVIDLVGILVPKNEDLTLLQIILMVQIQKDE